MDLSKLPKMSDTRRAKVERMREPQSSGLPVSEEPPAVPPDNPARPPSDSPKYDGSQVIAADASAGAWMSLIVGLLLVLFMPRWWQWIAHRSFGANFTWTFTNPDGSPLAYEHSVFFWGDLAITLFAVALLVEGVALLLTAGSRASIWFTLAVVSMATIVNLGYLVYMFARGYGIQLPSALASAFGVFMCVQQWQLLHAPRRRYRLVEV